MWLFPSDSDGFYWFTVTWLLWSITAIICCDTEVSLLWSGVGLWFCWVVVLVLQLPLQHVSVQRYVLALGQTSCSQLPLYWYQSHHPKRNASNLWRGKLQTRVRAVIIYSSRSPTWEIILRPQENWVCFLAVAGTPIGTCFVICLIRCSACVLIQTENKSRHAHSWPCFLRTDPQIRVHRITIFGLPNKDGHTQHSSVGHFQLKNPCF